MAPGKWLGMSVGRRIALLIVAATLAMSLLVVFVSPFASVQYEGGQLRYAVGLYLSREIARLHGGTLRVVRNASGEAVLLLELPT